jgi:hypothetical protein
MLFRSRMRGRARVADELEFVNVVDLADRAVGGFISLSHLHTDGYTS